MELALIGATGLVGTKMLQLLEERNFPITKFYPVASERSIGKEITFQDKQYPIVSMQTAIEKKPQIAIFSAGGNVSLEFAPKFAEVGTTVIDNSSAWRMNPKNKLIVPEINAGELTKEDKIIANPNCSTIQLVMAMAPLHKRYTIKRVVISTYQSITGTGQAAVQQMESERNNMEPVMVYPHKIDKNCLPHCDVFEANGYTKEEMKLVNEPRKILSSPDIKITATAVRVPVVGGHSEAVNIEFENDFSLQEVRNILQDTHGISLVDNPENNQYPMPIDAHEKDEVLVGRIRKDESQDNTLNMWIVADNLRKGAATNAIQIAEYLAQNNLI